MTLCIEFHEVLVTVHIITNTVFVSGSQLCQSVMPVGVEKISTSQKYVLARRRLVKLINNRAKLLSLCSCILNEVTVGTGMVTFKRFFKCRDCLLILTFFGHQSHTEKDIIIVDFFQ